MAGRGWALGSEGSMVTEAIRLAAGVAGTGFGSDRVSAPVLTLISQRDSMLPMMQRAEWGVQVVMAVVLGRKSVAGGVPGRARTVSEGRK